jgi:hypothetical protein
VTRGATRRREKSNLCRTLFLSAVDARIVKGRPGTIPPRDWPKSELMGSADCEPTLRPMPGRFRHVYLQGGLSSAPELRPFLCDGTPTRRWKLKEAAN